MRGALKKNGKPHRWRERTTGVEPVHRSRTRSQRTSTHAQHIVQAVGRVWRIGAHRKLAVSRAECRAANVVAGDGENRRVNAPHSDRRGSRYPQMRGALTYRCNQHVYEAPPTRRGPAQRARPLRRLTPQWQRARRAARGADSLCRSDIAEHNINKQMRVRAAQKTDRPLTRCSKMLISWGENASGGMCVNLREIVVQ